MTPPQKQVELIQRNLLLIQTKETAVFKPAHNTLKRGIQLTDCRGRGEDFARDFAGDGVADGLEVWFGTVLE